MCVCVFKFLLFGTLSQIVVWKRATNFSVKGVLWDPAIKAQPLHMAAAAFGVLHLGEEGRQAAVLIDAPFPR